MPGQYVEILSFHPRRHHNYEQAARIAARFSTFAHATGMFFTPAQLSRLTKLLPRLAPQIRKRSYTLDLSRIVIPHTGLELRYRLWDKLTGRKNWEAYEDAFQRRILASFQPPKLCIGFDHLSHKVFETWKGKSFLILDLVIGVPQYRAMMDAGKSTFSPDILLERSQDDQKLYAIYQKELELADLVLCGSEFVRHTCLTIGVPDEKLRVVEYGVDVERFSKPDKIYKSGSSGLKFMFAGAAGYRKGTDILVQAWSEVIRRYPGNELHIFGKKELPFADAAPGVFFHGHVNQAILIEALSQGDVFVFPSTFEGSAYSIYQAMAMKLPVITTPNSGSVVQHEVSGLITPVGDAGKLAQAIGRMIADEALRIRLAEAAWREALQYTWDHYGQKLTAILEEILQRH